MGDEEKEEDTCSPCKLSTGANAIQIHVEIHLPLRFLTPLRKFNFSSLGDVLSLWLFLPIVVITTIRRVNHPETGRKILFAGPEIQPRMVVKVKSSKDDTA